MSPTVLTDPKHELSEFFGMVTKAPQMREFFELVERVARTDSAVLIRGETGTGKELVARAIHQLSRRQSGPFRAVNCATFTPELLASELFGHVRGAFTGAVRDRQGLFELADTGTVFLDEIAEIPLEIQARLLRVLQDHTFTPVGGTDPIRVDVRLLSATHQALRREVKKGRFRQDLMYRIRVVPIFIPRLVEREGDIEALLWRFIETFNEERERTIEGVSSDAMQAILDYRWPGNVRELRNVVEFAFAVGTGPVLTLADLTPELRGEAPPGRDDAPKTPADEERERILEALDRAGGRKSKAAELLGMSRSTLWRKLREYKIS